eukprot:5761362-Pyramimonas_sp.AAC.1
MTRPPQLKPVYIRKLLRLDFHGGQAHANKNTDGELHAVNNLAKLGSSVARACTEARQWAPA